MADTISRLPFGPITAMTLGNGLAVTNEFDQLYRLTNIAAGELYNRSYAYYATGNIKTITDNIEAAATQNFSYDDLGRITGATGKYGELSYQHDAIGNRASSSDNGLLTTYGYEDDTNRLSSLTSESETINYNYDPVGNLLAKNEQSFTWSPDSRLLRVTNNTQTLGEYGYDARGLRTIRTTAEQTVMTLYDQSGNMLVETDEEGNTLREFAYIDGQRISLFDYLPLQLGSDHTNTDQGRGIFFGIFQARRKDTVFYATSASIMGLL